MKKYFKPAVVLAVIMAALGAQSASAQGLKDLLGGGTIGNLVEGIFTKTNLSLEDIVGEWKADGSAVSFKSDNALMKAGGVAAAAAVEAKLDPYYEKLGLNNADMTVKSDGTFSIQAGKVKLGGTMTSNGDGTFEVNFKALGKISLGKMTAYVQKSGNTIEIMFDATKIKSLVSAVAGVTGISLAKTAAQILDSYDGMCVGWSMQQVGGSTPSGGLDSVLGNILGGGSKSSSTSTPSSQPEETPAGEESGNSTSGSNGASSLLNVLKNGLGK